LITAATEKQSAVEKMGLKSFLNVGFKISLMSEQQNQSYN